MENDRNYIEVTYAINKEEYDCRHHRLRGLLWQMADALRGSMVYSTHRKLTDEKIARIAITYHAWLCDFKSGREIWKRLFL